jgi:hypothetical protein
MILTISKGRGNSVVVTGVVSDMVASSEVSYVKCDKCSSKRR